MAKTKYTNHTFYSNKKHSKTRRVHLPVKSIITLIKTFYYYRSHVSKTEEWEDFAPVYKNLNLQKVHPLRFFPTRINYTFLPSRYTDNASTIEKNCFYLPIKDPSLFQNIAQIYVGI